MSNVAVAALAVSELSRFAEAKPPGQSVSEKYTAQEESVQKPSSETESGVGESLDISV
jgi:hypothetical protein